jgi:hypothetical protein
MSKTKTYKADLDKIRVTFPNGDFIEEDIVKQTFAKAIIRLDVKRVYDLKIWGNKKHKILLVDNRLTDVEIYRKQQEEIAPGYYLLVYNNTDKKAKWLEQISDALHENLKVEIIKNHVKSSTPISSPNPQPILPTKPVTIQKNIVGQVEKADGLWRFNTGDAPKAKKVSTIHFIENGNIAHVPFTDSVLNTDVLVIKHDGKIGVYSLTPIGTIIYPAPAQWLCTTDDPFPYDDIRVLGMNRQQYGYIAFCIDGKWGGDKAYFSYNEDRVFFMNKVKCDNDSFEAAIAKIWKKPFD